MLNRVLASITIKLAFAVLLIATAVASSAGSLRCFVGLPMSGCITEKNPVALSATKGDSCCLPEKSLTAKQEEQGGECCCIQALKKQPTDGTPVASVEFRFDFPILLETPVRFDFDAIRVSVEQVRIPNVHDPPGIATTSASPRAPPAI